MDWFRVVAAGVGGALGAAFGIALAARFIRDPAKNAWRTALRVAPIVLFAELGSSLAGSQKVRDLLSPPSRLEMHLRRYTSGVVDSDAVKARLAALPPDQARHAAQTWSHAGLKRLDAADLERWNAIRLDLAKRSKPVCVGLWTGKLDSAVFVGEMEKLSDADLDAWAHLSMTAMKRAIESPDTPPPADALGKALQTIDAKLAPDDSVRFQRDLRAGVGIPPDEACWAFTTVAQTAANLEPAEREAALRALASL